MEGGGVFAKSPLYNKFALFCKSVLEESNNGPRSLWMTLTYSKNVFCNIRMNHKTELGAIPVDCLDKVASSWSWLWKRNTLSFPLYMNDILLNNVSQIVTTGRKCACFFPKREVPKNNNFRKLLSFYSIPLLILVQNQGVLKIVPKIAKTPISNNTFFT